MWDLPNPVIKPMSSALAGGFLPLSHQESPKVCFLFNSRLSWLGLHCFEGFSLAATSGDYSLVTMYGLLSAVVSLVSAHGLSSCRFSCLVAYVGSSRSRDKTHVPALAGKLNHWTTREVLPTLHCWEIALGSPYMWGQARITSSGMSASFSSPPPSSFMLTSSPPLSASDCLSRISQVAVSTLPHSDKLNSCPLWILQSYLWCSKFLPHYKLLLLSAMKLSIASKLWLKQSQNLQM